MANTFFTADLHLNHSNIIEHCKRPFKDVNEMNDAIIKNWNSKVGSGDLTYVLGDLVWKDPDDLISQLNGQIFLVKGNHDWVTDHKKIVKVRHLYSLNKDGQHVVLCHYGMRVWNKSHYNSWHLYGHSHGGLPAQGKSFDVGVDCWGFTPLSWEDIKFQMQGQPDNINFIKERRDEYL